MPAVTGAGDFGVGAAVQYFSTSKGIWVDATVEQVSQAGELQITCKPGYWIPLAEQAEKLRAAPGASKALSFQVGSAVQYYSASAGTWIDAVVEQAQASGEVQVSCKPGYWMPVSEQKEKLRVAPSSGIEKSSNTYEKKLNSSDSKKPAGSNEKLLAESGEVAASVGEKFAVGAEVMYYSQSQRRWIECYVVDVAPSGELQVSIKPDQWMSPTEQREKLKLAPKKEPRRFTAGDAAQYYSASQGSWIDTVVEQVQSSGEVQVTCKPGYWMPLAEQAEKLRPKPSDGEQEQRPQGDWAEENSLRLGKLGDEAAFLGRVQVLDIRQVSSVHTALERLKKGVLKCPDGFCVAYSASSQRYYLLYRHGRKEEAMRRLALDVPSVDPAAPPKWLDPMAAREEEEALPADAPSPLPAFAPASRGAERPPAAKPSAAKEAALPAAQPRPPAEPSAASKPAPAPDKPAAAAQGKPAAAAQEAKVGKGAGKGAAKTPKESKEKEQQEASGEARPPPPPAAPLGACGRTLAVSSSPEPEQPLVLERGASSELPSEQQERLLKVQEELKVMAEKLWEVDGAKFESITPTGLKAPVTYKASDVSQGDLPAEAVLAAAARFPEQVEGVRELFQDLRAWLRHLEQQPGALAEVGRSLDAGYRRRIFTFLCALPAVRRVFLYQAAALLETLSCEPDWCSGDAVDKGTLQAVLMQSPARSNSQALLSEYLGSLEGAGEGQGRNPFDDDELKGDGPRDAAVQPSAKRGWWKPRMPWRGSSKD